MSLQSFTDWLLSRRETPDFLKTTHGARVLGAVGLIFDVVGSALQSAVTSAWVTHPNIPSDGLDLVGRSRLMPRYPDETDAAYSTRLQGAWSTWTTAGNKSQLEAELSSFGLSGAYTVGTWEWDGAESRLNYDGHTGNPFVDGESLTIDGGLITADVVTAHPAYLRVKNISGGTPANDDTIVGDTSGASASNVFPGQTEIRPAWADPSELDNWSRFWVYIPYGSHTAAVDANWDDPGVWDDGGVWDYEGISPQYVTGLKTLIETFRAAHEIPVRIRFMTSVGSFTAPDTYSGTSFTLEMYA